MYIHKRGVHQTALLALASPPGQEPPNLLCKILYGSKESIQVQLYDPDTGEFDSWILTYPSRAIVSILQPPVGMSDEKFLEYATQRDAPNGPTIERGN